jgi:phospholipid-binding lipoprotein MlaA
MPSTARVWLLSVCLLGGCAALPPGTQRDPRDPWERMNRTSYHFNDVLDRAIIKPVARTYAKAPQPVRTGLGNFWDNASYPVTITNDLLQGQVRAFFSDITRFVLNSTFGLAGFLDLATRTGMEKNNRDFGQTLGKWGVPAGPYLMVPLLGPYTVRDGLGASTVDTLATPRTYAPFWIDTGLFVAQEIDLRSRLLYLDPMIQSAYDPYAFVRNAYLRHRDFMVEGGGSRSEQEREEKLLEEAGEEENTPAGAAPPTQPPQPPATQPPAPQGQPQPPPQNPH